MRKPAKTRSDLNKGLKSRHELQEQTGSVYVRRPKLRKPEMTRMDQTQRNIYGNYKEPPERKGVYVSPLRTIRSP